MRELLRSVRLHERPALLLGNDLVEQLLGFVLPGRRLLDHLFAALFGEVVARAARAVDEWARVFLGWPTLGAKLCRVVRIEMPRAIFAAEGLA
jgi:hypothetical protein